MIQILEDSPEIALLIYLLRNWNTTKLIELSTFFIVIDLPIKELKLHYLLPQNLTLLVIDLPIKELKLLLYKLKRNNLTVIDLPIKELKRLWQSKS